jgi:ketosteroid isomerase-like protein
VEPKQIVAEALATFDRKGADAFVDYFAADGEVMTPFGTFRGREEIQNFMRGMMSAFSESRHDVDFYSDGDVVVVEGTWTGRHTGPLVTPQGEAPPTGREARSPFAGIVRVRDGRIVSLHNYYDGLGFMAQLGLMPEPATV